MLTLPWVIKLFEATPIYHSELRHSLDSELESIIPSWPYLLSQNYRFGPFPALLRQVCLKVDPYRINRGLFCSPKTDPPRVQKIRNLMVIPYLGYSGTIIWGC